MTHLDWIATIRDGDVNALPILLEYLETHVRAKLRKALRRGVDIDDVLAETLIRAVDDLKHLPDASGLEAYLCAIAEGAARGEARARKSAVSLSPSLSCDRRKPPPESPSQILERNDLLLWLVADLSSRERKLIDLLFFQELSPPELQQELGLRAGVLRIFREALLARLRRKAATLPQ